MCASYKVGQWVLIFKKEWYVREVCSVEDDMIQVKCMKRIRGNLNKFAWQRWYKLVHSIKNNDFINSCLEI